jgi:hypothetical protein
MQIKMELEDWVEKPLEEEEDATPDPTASKRYLSYRFTNLDISAVTVENYKEILKTSLSEQVSMFIHPSGSFKTPDLQRYLELLKSYETSSNDVILGLSLADQIRITFSDMQSATICERFSDIDLQTKRRYRCVAEYLIRQNELTKLKDENGKLIKKIGNLNKQVVIYCPLPKIRDTLKRSGLSDFIRPIPGEVTKA